MKYKIVACDCDDTLLKSDNTISQNTLNTVAEYTARGGVFMLSTGRMYRAAKPFVKRLGLTGAVIAYQGACIYDGKTDKLLYDAPISCRAAYKILKECERRGLHVQIYYGDNLYVSQYNDYVKMYEKWCDVSAIKIDGDLSAHILEGKIDITKALVIEEAQRAKALLYEFRKEYGGDFLFNISKPNLLEIVSAKAGKGRACEFVAKSLGLSSSDVMAIGDSLNDISMLKYAGLSVAVANAVDEVKKIADVTTDSNDSEGVANALKKYCLS
jgi:Cof subfamily protein (haloacid dehalogenase superfamily)